MSLFWSGTRPKSFHRFNKGPNHIITQKQHIFGNIFGRYSFHGKNNRGIINE